jgi:hypothetical protein
MMATPMGGQALIKSRSFKSRSGSGPAVRFEVSPSDDSVLWWARSRSGDLTARQSAIDLASDVALKHPDDLALNTDSHPNRAKLVKQVAQSVETLLQSDPATKCPGGSGSGSSPHLRAGVVRAEEFGYLERFKGHVDADRDGLATLMTFETLHRPSAIRSSHDNGMMRSLHRIPPGDRLSRWMTIMSSAGPCMLSHPMCKHPDEIAGRDQTLSSTYVRGFFVTYVRGS